MAERYGGLLITPEDMVIVCLFNKVWCAISHWELHIHTNPPSAAGAHVLVGTGQG
jgi:hypothetical protein